jgi:hypothetical protein
MKFCVICGEQLVKSPDSPEIVPEQPQTVPTEPETAPKQPETTPPEPQTVPTEPKIVPTEPETPPEIPQTEPAPPEPIYTPISEEEEPEPEPETEIVEIKKAKKVKVFRSIPAAVASIILGICVFALILSTGLLAAVRFATYPENIEGMVEGIDILSLPPPRELTGIVDTDARDLGDAVYVYAESTGFSKDDILRIYETATFRDELVALLSGYAGFLRDGIVPPDIKTDDIKQLFSENIAVLSEIHGAEIPKSEIENAYESIDNSADYLPFFSIHNLTAKGAQFVNIVRSLMSYPGFAGLTAVLLLIILLIARINKKAAPALAVTGVAGVTAAALTAFAVLLFSNELIGIPELYKGIAGGALTYLSPPIYITSAAVALIGIIFIVIGRALARKAS